MIILDNFDKRNILSILNYTSGVKFVRNFILYEKNESSYGYGDIKWGTGATTYTLKIFIYHITTEYVIAQANNAATFIEAINSTSALRDLGIFAEEISYAGQAFRITCDSTTDFRDFIIRIITTAGSDTLYYGNYGSFQGGGAIATDRPLQFVLIPFDDNQVIKASNTNSQLIYGRKIHVVNNKSIIDTPLARQTALDNKLNELYLPKARCFVDIPFDYNQPTELEETQVQLAPENSSRFRNFIEGGHFKTWTDAGSYRYKNFYIIGISHSKEGSYTRLRLIEKL